MKTAIESMGKASVLRRVEMLARQIGVPDDLGIDIVCSACCDNIDLAPAKRSKKISTDHEALVHWVTKFYNGYKGRPSQKTGTPPPKPLPIRL